MFSDSPVNRISLRNKEKIKRRAYEGKIFFIGVRLWKESSFYIKIFGPIEGGKRCVAYHQELLVRNKLKFPALH